MRGAMRAWAATIASQVGGWYGILSGCGAVLMALAFGYNLHIYNEYACFVKGTLWHSGRGKMRERTKSGEKDTVLVLLTQPTFGT